MRSNNTFEHSKSTVWEASSGSESIELRDWQTENSTSGWGSFWERSLVGSRISTSGLRNVPGTVPESVRICGLKRISSNLDRTPKMRNSVLLNSWDSFLVTLSSISSETCVIYSLLILRTNVLRDWQFLGCYSCVSLETAALFLNIAIFWKEKCENAQQWWRLNYLFTFNELNSTMKRSFQLLIINWFTEVEIKFFHNSDFVPPI